MSPLEDRRTLWVVAALIVVLFAIANLPWQLYDYDQAKQAFTSFEMVKERHWLYQHMLLEHVATKAPFVAWVGVAISSLARSWEGVQQSSNLSVRLVFVLELVSVVTVGYG